MPVKISKLTLKPVLDGSEEIEVNDAGNTKKVTAAGIAALNSVVSGVTSVSVGGLSPLFTANVATATTTPAITFAQVNQNANLVFAGPSSGSAAAPTFRSLVAADIPGIAGFTEGSIIFANSTGILSQNNTNLFWDNTNNRLRVNNSASISFLSPQTGTLLHFISESATFNGRASFDSYVGSQSTGSIYQGRTARGTIASPSAVTADQVLASFGADGYGATGFHGSSVGSVTIRAEATFTDTSAPTYVTISTTASGSTTSTEALRVTSAQDIIFGTGTITNATRYDFRGSASSTTLARFANSSNQAAVRVQSVSGEILFGTGSSTYIGPGTLGSLGITGTGIVLRASNSGGFHTLIGGSNMNTSAQIRYTTTAGPMVAVSSTTGFWMDSNPSFSNATAQTSVEYTFDRLAPSINATGGSTTVRAIDFNPTETSLTGVTKYGLTIGGTNWLNGFNTRTPHSTAHINGSFALVISTKTGNYSFTDSDFMVVLTSGTATFTLPTAVGISGRMYILRVTGGTLTAATTSSQTIDGSSPGSVATELRVVSDGANWITW